LLLAVVSRLCSDGRQAEALGVGDLNGHIIAKSLIDEFWTVNRQSGSNDLD
jgi:hypothetical protein